MPKRQKKGRDLAGMLAKVGSGSTIARTFELMSVAEELLREAGEPEGGFMLLTPPRGFTGLDDCAYRAHARELLVRLKAGEDVRPATDAEVLVDLLCVALKAPLTHEGQALAEHLFARLFPEHPIASDGQACREAWPGQVAEALADAKRKLRVDR